MKRMTALLAGVMMMAASTAFAVPYLTLTTDVRSFDVVDGGIGDYNGAAGVISYAGSFDGWLLDLSTGISPTFGTPSMHLNNLTVGSGNLTITFTDDLSTSWFGTGARVSVGGTLMSGGTANFKTFINDNNVSSMTGFKGQGSFAGDEFFRYDVTGEENVIKMIAEINHTSFGTSSFDYDVTPVPEPATLLLLGSGFLGLAVYGKRFKQS